MKKYIFVFLLMIFFLFTLDTIFAQRGTAQEQVIPIRFGSTLPRNSDWGRTLDRIAAEWERVTNGAVRVIINHDGAEGNEERMLSSLTSNSIQVALFTTAGLSRICPASMTLSVPFMIKNNAELDLVLSEIKPILDNRVDNNYVVIAWSKGGWVYVFSKEPLFTPDDLRRQRLATSPEFRDLNVVFRTMRFQLVESDMTRFATMLTSNRIDALYSIPAAITPFGLQRYLGNMLNMPIAPVMGAIVMNRVTWNRLSPAHQQEILRVTQRIAGDFDASVASTEANAITSLGRSGFGINTPNQAQDALWRTELESILPSLIGTTFDRDLYQRINQILQRTRSGQ